jgi:glycosyltransferase involved in cell wall biosynthesis
MSDFRTAPEPPLRVGYVLLRFPKLTETFIAEEIAALGKTGVTVKIVSLLKPRPEAVQPGSQALLRDTWYAPGLTRPSFWGAQIRSLVRSPVLYSRLLFTLLRQRYPRKPWLSFLKRLVIFGRAVASTSHLEDEGVQVLHAHFAWLPGAAAWAIAQLIGKPYSVTVHAFDLYEKTDLLPLVCSRAQRVVTISDYNKEEIVRLGASPEDRVSIVRCGIDLDRFRPGHGGGVLPDTGGPLRILSIGRFVAKKGFADLLAACGMLKKRGIDFACTIIGSGPEERLLRGLIQAHGLEDRVRLAGTLVSPEVVAEFRRHNVFALACTVAPGGDKDGIPVVLMEAGAMGLPLVSTRVSGIPELVRDQSSGLLIPPARPEALADALASLAADPALRSTLGRNARLLVEREYDILHNAARLQDIFTGRRLDAQGALSGRGDGPAGASPGT